MSGQRLVVNGRADVMARPSSFSQDAIGHLSAGSSSHVLGTVGDESRKWYRIELFVPADQVVLVDTQRVYEIGFVPAPSSSEADTAAACIRMLMNSTNHWDKNLTVTKLAEPIRSDGNIVGAIAVQGYHVVKTEKLEMPCIVSVSRRDLRFGSSPARWVLGGKSWLWALGCVNIGGVSSVFYHDPGDKEKGAYRTMPLPTFIRSVIDILKISI